MRNAEIKKISARNFTKIVNELQTFILSYISAFCIIISALFSLSQAQEQRFSVGEIRFRGNYSLTNRELLNSMRLQPSGIFKKREFNENRLINDIQSIEALYRFKGWHRISVKVHSLRRDMQNRKVYITLNVSEGPRYTISSLRFFSSDFQNENFYSEIAGILPGSPLDSSLIEMGRIRLLNALHDQGHQFASVIYHIDFPAQTSGEPHGEVSYIVRKGPLAAMGGVEIFGLKRVRPKIVERDLVFDKGQIITPRLIERSRKRLLSTDLFSSVFIIPVDTLESPEELDTVDAQIAVIVTEKDMAAVQVAAGYGAYQGWFIDLELLYRNLFGLGHRISVRGRYSHWDRGGELNYVYPHLFGNFADGSARIYGERRLQSDYDGVFWGGRIAAFDKPDDKWYNWRFFVRAEHTSSITTDPPTPLYPWQPMRDTYALGAQLRFGHTDVTSLGWAAEINGELAGPFLTQTNQFYTIMSSLRLQYPLLAGITAVVRAQGAFGAGYGSTSGLLPVQERFWLGFDSISPISGFSATELMPKDESGRPRGAGAVLVFTPFELRIPLYWRFQGALFVNTGYAWRRPGVLNMSDLRTAAGPGLIFALPQGKVRLDYGIQIPQGKQKFNLYLENF
ncbi:MAG: BamA/TamA family outer membrane protein [Chitinispirillales bacterium]|jgi:outer membrane protein insertion porin family|nr:BamA/TamA family outer membrane protein [Chitinispirillales bacterium]